MGPISFKSGCSSSESLDCFYCNARSLKNKFHDLHVTLYAKQFNIICISETWLSASVTDGLLDPRGLYNIYRKDRSDGYGGVCIFVSRRIKSISIDFNYHNISNIELVACRIILSSVTFNVGCFYCAPDVSLEYLI